MVSIPAPCYISFGGGDTFNGLFISSPARAHATTAKGTLYYTYIVMKLLLLPYTQYTVVYNIVGRPMHSHVRIR